MRSVLVTALLATLAACGAAEPAKSPRPKPAAASPIAEPGRAEAVILPASAIPEMLGQCSRLTPERGEDSWRPGWADVDALQRALPAALKAEPRAAEIVAAGAPKGWGAQYVGLVRGGRRYVYANFFRLDASRGDFWRTQPVVVCDGGASYFGVEYDVEAGWINQLEFNGLA